MLDITYTPIALQAALVKAGHGKAAAAARANGETYQPFVLDMTPAAAVTIAKIAIKRAQGYRPYVCVGAVVCAHVVVCATEETDIRPDCGPAFYWMKVGSAWVYRSCTGHTEASVAPDGTLTGRSRTGLGRKALEAARPWRMGDARPAGVLTTPQAQAWATDAASRADDLAPADASFALAMGAPEWESWNG